VTAKCQPSGPSGQTGRPAFYDIPTISAWRQLPRSGFSSPVSSPPILHSLAPQLSGSEGHLIKSFGIHFDNY